ncbi:MAG TPA: hypothetical protein VFS00_31445 [Polyangiaceae bacterium]|nr:hypothetical protein [Polyangiaceae bacterium]
MPRAPLFAALTALTALATTAVPADARCVGDFARVWPSADGGPVPTNARLLMHLGGERSVKTDLRALRLEPARGRPVALRVAVEQSAGDGFRPQRMLVLAPERELAPNTRYTLAGAAFPARGVSYSLTTSASADTVAPSTGGVATGAFVAEEFGCGPAHQIPITFSAARDDRSPPGALWGRLRLARNADDAKAGRWLGDIVTPLEDGALSFGHGMCFGNWPLEPGDRFVAHASVVDVAMNESPATQVTLAAR